MIMAYKVFKLNIVLLTSTENTMSKIPHTLHLDKMWVDLGHVKVANEEKPI